MNGLRKFFYKHSIKSSLTYPLIYLFGIGFILSVLIIYIGSNYLIKNSAFSLLNSEKVRFIKNLEDKKEFIAHIAFLLADDPKIKEAILSKKDVLIEQQIFHKLEITDKFMRYYPIFIEIIQNSRKGDGLYTKAIKSKTLAVGFERDPILIRLRAVVPICAFSPKEKCNTAIEVSMKLKEIIANFPLNEGEGVVLFSTSLKDILFKNITLSAGDLRKIKKYLSSGTTSFRLNKNIFNVFNILDSNSKEIAKIVLVRDISSLLYKRNIIIIFLCGIFISGYLITFFFIRSEAHEITCVLNEIKDNIKSSIFGNFSNILLPYLNTYCWDKLNCKDKKCPVYNNKKHICFLVAGDFAYGSNHKDRCGFLKEFNSCEYCPVFLNITKNELNATVLWYNNFLNLLRRFFYDAVNKLTDIVVISKDAFKETMMIRAENIVKEIVQITVYKKTLEKFEDKKEIYNYMLWFLKEHFNFYNYVFFEVNNSENRFELIENFSQELEHKISYDLLVDCNLCAVKRNGEPISSIDYPNICSYSNIDGDKFFHICFPIIMGGHVGGVLKVIVKKGREKELSKQAVFIQKYLEESAPIIEAKRALAVAKQQALRDQLTNLYNRRFMEEYLSKWNFIIKRQRGKAGILMIDLDHFKKVNDTFGHYVGDIVLKKVAYILTSNLRNSDVIFRYGGEEIMVFLPDSSKQDCINIAEKLRSAVEIAEFEANGNKFKITISIGVACCPEDNEDLHEVIKLADKALYIAKQRGRNRVIPYDPHMECET